MRFLMIKLAIALGIFLFCSEIQAFRQRSDKRQSDADVESWTAVKEHKDDLAKLKQKLKYLEKRNSILTESLHKRNSADKQRCRHLRTKISRTSRKIEDLKRHLSVCVGQACELEGMKTKLAKLLTDYRQMELLLSLLPPQVEACNIQTPTLTKRVEGLRNTNKDLINQISKLEEQLSTCTEANIKLYETLENVKKENEDLKNQINSLIKDVASLRTKVKDCIAKKTAELHAILENLENVNQSVQVTLRALTIQETKTQASLDLCTVRNEALSKEIVALQPCNKTISDLRRQCVEAMKGLQPLVNLNDKMYYFSTLEMRNFEGAVEFCRSHGMELASVPERGYDRLISNRLNQILGAATGPDSYYYFGLNDRFYKNFFTFAGSGLAIDFQNWSQGEPNNAAAGFDCVVYQRPNVFVNNWRVVHCNSSARFICELTEPCNTLNFVSLANF